MVVTTGYVSATEAAELLGMSSKTIQRWIAAGRLPARKIGRSFQISVSDLSALTGRPVLQASETTARPAASPSASTDRPLEPGGLGVPRTSTSALSELIAALEEELVDTAAAAAKWQVRSRILAARLEQAERTIEELQRSEINSAARRGRTREASLVSRSAAS